MKSCSTHPSEIIEFVCLDKTCEVPTSFACFFCVRSSHCDCSDETLLDLEDFMQLEIRTTNLITINKEMLNRANTDMKRVCSMMKNGLLKKKDLLLDFLSLNGKDLLENFPQVFKMYRGLLFFEHNSAARQVTVSSVYRFMSPKEIKKSMITNFEKDVLEFIEKNLKLDNSLMEGDIPELVKKYDFDLSKVEVNLKKDDPKVLEFYNKQTSKPLKVSDKISYGMFNEGETDSEYEEDLLIQSDKIIKGNKIVIKSLDALKGDNEFKIRFLKRPKPEDMSIGLVFCKSLKKKSNNHKEQFFGFDGNNLFGMNNDIITDFSEDESEEEDIDFSYVFKKGKLF